MRPPWTLGLSCPQLLAISILSGGKTFVLTPWGWEINTCFTELKNKQTETSGATAKRAVPRIVKHCLGWLKKETRFTWLSYLYSFHRPLTASCTPLPKYSRYRRWWCSEVLLSSNEISPGVEEGGSGGGTHLATLTSGMLLLAASQGPTWSQTLNCLTLAVGQAGLSH